MNGPSIKEIDKILAETPMERLNLACMYYSQDTRPGVQRVIEKHLKRLDSFRNELNRLDEMMLYERKYADYPVIAGIDEAGRGPLAGPVVAAAVILPKNKPILYVNDSKKLSEKKREELYDVIRRDAVSVGIGTAEEEKIDEINILQATFLAMTEAALALEMTPSLILVDGNHKIPSPELSLIRQVTIVKGDAKSASIAAASIIAKVTRDRIMREYDRLYPEYGFAENKGYGSEKHVEALKKYGPCPIHRKSFIERILNE